MLFRGRGQDPVLLVGAELQEHLEAFCRRNQGSRQRARECARSSRAASAGVGRSVELASGDDPVAGPSADRIVLEDEDWGSAAVDWELLLEEDVDFASGQTAQPVAAESEATSPASQGPHQEWSVVPYVPLPPPELEILPIGVPPTEFVEQVLTWCASGLPYRHVIDAAKNFWGIWYEEEFTLLHLAVHLVLGTRRMVAQGLMEAALLRMQEDPTGATLLAGFLNDLLRMLQ